MTREAPKAAVDLYKRFNRFEPKKIGDFAGGFKIPTRVRFVGPAKWVTYSSAKVDPATLKKPRQALSYIHEHDGGVKCCLTDGRPDTDVPAEFANIEALVLLGKSLGFSFADDQGHEVEAECTRCELYASPGDGRCLFVVEGKSKVLAMIWGGSLRVEGRGIVG